MGGLLVMWVPTSVKLGILNFHLVIHGKTEPRRRRHMQIVRNADFAEVVSCFGQENCRSETNAESESFGWGVDELQKVQKEIPDQWKLVLLSKSDILGIVIRGGHDHSVHGAKPLIRSDEVLSIAEAIERLLTSDRATMPKCWENISYQKDQDISQTHFFLKRTDGQLWHIDGFHRMLAWLLSQGGGTVEAFVAG
jgi:hypothetical protein